MFDNQDMVKYFNVEQITCSLLSQSKLYNLQNPSSLNQYL